MKDALTAVSPGSTLPAEATPRPHSSPLPLRPNPGTKPRPPRFRNLFFLSSSALSPRLRVSAVSFGFPAVSPGSILPAEATPRPHSSPLALRPNPGTKPRPPRFRNLFFLSSSGLSPHLRVSAVSFGFPVVSPGSILSAQATARPHSDPLALRSSFGTRPRPPRFRNLFFLSSSGLSPRLRVSAVSLGFPAVSLGSTLPAEATPRPHSSPLPLRPNPGTKPRPPRIRNLFFLSSSALSRRLRVSAVSLGFPIRSRRLSCEMQ
jgi:hypothetical protein